MTKENDKLPIVLKVKVVGKGEFNNFTYILRLTLVCGPRLISGSKMWDF